MICSTMKVSCKHQIDASERDENGLYDWYYEYDLYEFQIGPIEVIACSYIDEPNEVSILSIIEDGAKLFPIKPSDIGKPELIQVLAYLKNTKHMKIFKYLGSKGYSSVQSQYIEAASAI